MPLSADDMLLRRATLLKLRTCRLWAGYQELFITAWELKNLTTSSILLPMFSPYISEMNIFASVQDRCLIGRLTAGTRLWSWHHSFLPVSASAKTHPEALYSSGKPRFVYHYGRFSLGPHIESQCKDSREKIVHGFLRVRWIADRSITVYCFVRSTFVGFESQLRVFLREDVLLYTASMVDRSCISSYPSPQVIEIKKCGCFSCFQVFLSSGLIPNFAYSSIRVSPM